jgi:ABC-type transport system involved in cytochrome c biogenesis permease subunit
MALVVAAPVLALMGVWLLLADARPGHFPATYATPLLYLHTVVGKLFLGLLLVAVALGGVPLLRQSAAGLRWLTRAGSDARLDQLAYRFAAAAFVCESLMLIVGAVWAQDACGNGTRWRAGPSSPGWHWLPHCTHAPPSVPCRRCLAPGCWGCLCWPS